MKKRNKIALLGIGLLTATMFLATGCTGNFCSDLEQARMMSIFEAGVSQFYAADDLELPEGNNIAISSTIVQHIDVDKNNRPNNNAILNQILDTAEQKGIFLPTIEYFSAVDKHMIENAFQEANKSLTDVYTTEEINNIIFDYGYVKFYGVTDEGAVGRWVNFDKVLNQVKGELEGQQCPSNDFYNVYKNILETSISSYRSCITTIPGEYGDYYGKPIHMEQVTWGDAWTKGTPFGLIEGLIVYPVAWLLDTFANLFANHNLAYYSQGVPQILSLVLVTIIVRLFIFLVTLKSTLSQQKMNALQPEIAKIQQKYPNANTNQAEKQRMSEETMRLYKKNKVNPLSSLLVLIVQFPVFIGVWGAMQGSAALSTGKFLNLGLSTSIWECLKMGPANHPGWWTALVLIILMSAGQFFSMKVPQWIQKAKTKKVSRLAKNPAEKEQNKTANIVSYVMLFMIIFMGFTLPAAMGVYWLVGALFSLVQSLIMNAVSSKKQRR